MKGKWCQGTQYKSNRKLIVVCFYQHIFDLQSCVSAFSKVIQLYIYIHSFVYSFPLWLITGYWTYWIYIYIYIYIHRPLWIYRPLCCTVVGPLLIHSIHDSFLISRLQSLTTVILEPRKIKSVTASNFSPSIYHEVMGPGLFKILKDDAVKLLHSIFQQIRKTQQWPQDWKRLVFISIPKKGKAKECLNYCTIAFISHASKVTFLPC